MSTVDELITRLNTERQEDWREWVEKIPAIPFPEGWRIRIIPPFAGAMARFMVEEEEKTVSVYLDCFGRLGAVDEPYWEVYPVNGDVGRVLMNDVAGLVELIEEAFND